MIANNLEIPCIFVCVNNIKEPFLKEILAGIEEEDIPYNVKNISYSESSILREVYTAAQESRMGIAIGIMDDRIILHFSKLKQEKPLIDVKLILNEKEKARIVGCNAARLYKVMPFKDMESVNMDLLEKIRASVISVIDKLNIKIT